MSNKKYFFYLIIVFWFSFDEIVKLFHSTQGVILSMFITSFVFVTVMLYKSILVFHEDKSADNIKVMSIHILGVLFYLAVSIIFAMNIQGSVWKFFDLVNLVLISLIIVIIFFTKGINFVKNYFAGVIKGIPQMAFAMTILLEGGDGVSWVMIVAFHLLTIPRVVMTWKQRENDKNNPIIKSMFYSDLINEISWVFVTMAFIVTKIFY